MANTTGEMPFLDHLEELRKRILLSLAGISVGFGIGWWLTTHFDLIQLVEAPIAPLIPGGKLTVMSATDPFMIVVKFAFILGLVLASPFVIYQVWLFLAPALTPREKRAIVPSLGIGFLLFAGGAALGWLYVVAPAVAWLLNFQRGTFTPLITYDSYMRLVVHLLVGMGISAELPLVMILLASLGIMSYRVYGRFRRYAVLGAFVGGAILAPTPEVSMMILFTIPLLLLYEIGVAGAWVVEWRRARAARIAAGIVLLILCLAPRAARAQVPPAPPPPSQLPPGAPDTGRKVTGQGIRRIDSSAMKRLGLPPGPTRTFGTPDSILQALLDRPGFAATQYAADSVSMVVSGQQILLRGHAATLRDGNQLEADRIAYDGSGCGVIQADGEPRMFPKGQKAMVGRSMTVKTCDDSSRALIGEAFTSTAEGGANWYIRGNLAVDSSGKRLFGAHTDFTSCDLPDPHYHFVAGQVKWVSQSVIVARPAVLYIRDVPVIWLPFIFQDTRRDRASGILIPHFGFNDIIRTNRNYNRQLTNLGYYWAPNDYMDATAVVNWYSNSYIEYGGTLNYKWLNRFITGSLTLRQQVQSNGIKNDILDWTHTQRFDASSSLTFSLNYQSSSTVQLYNAIDPLANTRNITSNINYTKRYAWGLVVLGGNRTEALGGGPGSMLLPSATITPTPFLLSPHITISPNFAFSSSTQFNNPIALQPVFTNGGVDSSIASALGSSRTTTAEIDLPSEIFGLHLRNQLRYADQSTTARTVVTQRVPVSPGSTDSITTQTVQGGQYSTGLDWDTGIDLPILFTGSWKVTPTVGVTNAVSGQPLFLRTPGSDGGWVSQGKKINFQLAASPTFFGFTDGGIGKFSRFRYTFAPVMSLSWSPATSISQAFARALGAIGGNGLPSVPATTLASITFHQSVDGKVKPAAKDTNTDPTHLNSLPKTQLISISTSTISYDFEQAKLPGRSGWGMRTLTNTFTSDLIPQLNVQVTHDLFLGDYTSDTAKFSPFLSNANISFAVSGRTFRPLARLFGLARKDSTLAAPPATAAPASTAPLALAPTPPQFGSNSAAPVALPRTGFTANINFSLSRQRPLGAPTGVPVTTEPGALTPLDPFGIGSLLPLTTPPDEKQIGLQMAFSPTQFWTVSWNTQYDLTMHQFESQVIHLQRDLHDWRASFDFTKNANGNFSLQFSVFLISLPEIKLPYNQTTIQQTPSHP